MTQELIIDIATAAAGERGQRGRQPGYAQALEVGEQQPFAPACGEHARLSACRASVPWESAGAAAPRPRSGVSSRQTGTPSMTRRPP